jgi:integrase
MANDDTNPENFVHRRVRKGKTRWVLDFFYVHPKTGERLRYRRDARARTAAGAVVEAGILYERACETGDPQGFKEPKKTSPKFSAFVEEHYRPLYLQGLKPGTRARYRVILRDHLLPFFGSTHLALIDSSMVRQFDAELRKQGIASPRHMVSLLRTVMTAATQTGHLLEEQLPKWPRYKQPSKIPSCPSPEDGQMLLEHTEGWLHTCVAAMWFLGLRISEVLAMTVADVDLAKGVVVVRRNFSGDGPEKEVVDTKGDADRALPICDALRPVLVAAVRNKLPAAPVVTRQDGQVPRRQHVYRCLISAQRKAGLPEFGCHRLRHAFGSQLMSAGVNPEVVRQLLGHRDLRVTQRYIHAAREEHVAAVQRLR